jgi:hypothetical protein
MHTLIRGKERELIAMFSLVTLPALGQAENLIANGDFELGATGFVTEYFQDFPGTCCAPGEFSIISNITDLVYVYPLPDHTSGTGLMIYFDSFTAPNKVAWSQQVSVEPDTYYTLSAWLGVPSAFPDQIPPSDPGIPKVDFLINGESVGMFRTLSSNAWLPFAALWHSGSSTSAEITIISRNLNYGGNDFVLDDIVLDRTVVGGLTVGLESKRVTCQNLTTGAVVHYTLTGGASWDCAALGLEVNPGDKIRIGVTGVAE